MGDVRVNPINVPALAAYAGNRIGNLGLRPPATTGGAVGQGLGALAKSMQAKRREGMATQEAQAGREHASGMQRERLQAMQAMQKERLEAAKAEKDKRFDEIMQKEGEAKAEKHDKPMLEKKAAAATMYLTSPELQKDEGSTKQYVDSLVKQGIYNEDEGEQFLKATPKQRATISQMDLVSSGKAAGILSTKEKAKQEKAPSSGEGNAKLSKTSESRVQKDIIDADETLGELKNLQGTFDESFVGASGAIKGAAYGAIDWASNAPGLEGKIGLGEENKKWLKKRSEFSSNTLALAMSYIKQLSGVQYSDKQLEFMRKFVPMPEDSPTIAKGKMNALSGKLNRLKDSKQKLLREGISKGSDEYKERFLNESQRILNSDAPQYSEEDIKFTMEKHGLSREDVMKRLENR